jgi:hypothetical protein
MTLATTTSADGLIVNKCAHCATYCVIALDDLHPVLAAGKRPQILCHHCQKLFAPGPDMNVPDEELSPPADSAPAVKHDDQPAVTADHAAHQSGQTAPENKPAASSARRTTFYIFLIACAVAGLYWLADARQLNLSDMIRILE